MTRGWVFSPTQTLRTHFEFYLFKFNMSHIIYVQILKGIDLFVVKCVLYF